MRALQRVLAVLAMGALLAATLGLSGCFSPSLEGKLTLKQPALAPPAISKDGVLRVGVDTSHAPYAGLADGKVIGIDVDIAAALAEEMGLKLEVIDTRGQNATTLLHEGTIDVVMGLQNDDASPFTDRKIGPYLVDGPAIFTIGLTDTPAPFDPTSLNGQQVAAQENSLSAYRIGKDYGEESVAPYPTLEAAFNQLTGGTYSYVAADAVVGSFIAVKAGNIQCLGIINDAQGVYIGVGSDSSDLAAAIYDALKSLRDNGSLQVIISRWLGPISATVVLKDNDVIPMVNTGGATSEGSADTGQEATPAPEDQAGDEGVDGGDLEYYDGEDSFD